jgi:hypothetical protein
MNELSLNCHRTKLKGIGVGEWEFQALQPFYDDRHPCNFETQLKKRN